MESEVLKYLWLIVLTLVQIIYVWIKIAERRNEKNNTPNNPSPPVDYHNHEGRISSVETAQEKLEKNNEKDHLLIRQDIRKIFNLFNGMKK